MARRKKVSKSTAEKAVPDASEGAEAESQWRSARLLASTVVGTMSPAIHALIPRFFDPRDGLKKGVQTMQVDPFFRVYVNNGFTEALIRAARKVTPESPCHCGATEHHDLAYVAGVIVHESQHPVRDHAARAEEINADPKLANIAWDLEINDDLMQTFKAAYEFQRSQGHAFPRLCLPESGVFPYKMRKQYPVEQYGIEFLDDRVGEEYYYKLVDLQNKKKAEDQQQQQQQGQGQDQQQQGKGQGQGQPQPQPQPQADPDSMSDEELKEYFDNMSAGGEGDVLGGDSPDCGSGATGGMREYDEGDPSPENPGISPAESDLIRKEIAQKVVEEGARRGKIPAGMRIWAETVLAKPKHNWKKELNKYVRKATTRAWGDEQRTWRKLGRRSVVHDYKLLYPSTFNPKPQVAVVLDTSGSMGRGEEGTALHDALTEVQGVCKAVGAEISFVSVDSASSDVHKVRKIQDVLSNLQGGGGTDMRVGINKILDSNESFDVCLVITDGDTPWPRKKPKTDCSIIAVLVGSRASNNEGRVPRFIKTVKVEKE